MTHPARNRPLERTAFSFVVPIQTRWADNDVYGHVNNVVYYAYFDTAIAALIMGEDGLDPLADDVVGVAVETGCRFHRSVAFPDRLSAGVGIGHLGNSSARYVIGIFKDDEPLAVADGHFVHVFVDRRSQRPVPIPPKIRRRLEHHPLR